MSLSLINHKKIRDGITIIAVITKNIPQSPFNQSTIAPDEAASVVLPAVPIEASKAYFQDDGTWVLFEVKETVFLKRQVIENSSDTLIWGGFLSREQFGRLVSPPTTLSITDRKFNSIPQNFNDFGR